MHQSWCRIATSHNDIMAHCDIHDNSWCIVTSINGYVDLNINKKLCHIYTCLSHNVTFLNHNVTFVNHNVTSHFLTIMFYFLNIMSHWNIKMLNWVSWHIYTLRVPLHTYFNIHLNDIKEWLYELQTFIKDC